MPRVKKMTFECVGEVADRNCKKSTLQLNIDPSPKSFLSKCKSREIPVGAAIKADDYPEIKPISVFGVLKGCSIEFESVSVPADRLGDLEFLIREKNAVCRFHFEAEWAELFDEPEGSAS